MPDDKHRSRIKAMAEDNGQTWDHSPKDIEALKWADKQLDHYERLQRKVAHGCTDANCQLCDRD